MKMKKTTIGNNCNKKEDDVQRSSSFFAIFDVV